MRDYFAYWRAVFRDLFNPERTPLEDINDEPTISETGDHRG